MIFFIYLVFCNKFHMLFLFFICFIFTLHPENGCSQSFSIVKLGNSTIVLPCVIAGFTINYYRYGKELGYS